MNAAVKDIAGKVASSTWRKLALLLLIGLAWELYGRWLDNDMLFPTLLQTLSSLVEGITSGVIPSRAGNSLKVLLHGYLLGTVLALMLAALGATTRIGAERLRSRYSPTSA